MFVEERPHVLECANKFRSFGPVAGASCKRFGPRLTAMAGGTLTCAGVIISSQATGIVFLIFSLGVLTAFGMSMATNASYTILGMYFKKRLAIAMGLATAGVSVGQLVLPPFFQYLIDHYGWKGSLMITSALTFHVAVAGALMRPPRIAKPKKPSRKSTGRTAEDEAKAEENGNNIESTGVGSLRALSLLNPSIFDAEDQVGSPNGMALGEGSIFQEEPDVAMTTDIEEDEDRIQYVDDDSWSLSSTPGGDMSALSHSVWVPIAVTALQSMPGKRRQRSFLPGRKPRSASMLSQTLQKQPSELLRLFRNPSFVIMLAVSIAHGFGWASTTYHLVSRAESVGVEPDKAALLLTAMGTGSLVGRLSIGWLADKKWIDPKIYYTCTFAFCALAAFITPPITVYYALIALALVQGLAFGAATVILFITPGRIVKPVLATTSLSYCLLAWGAGEISGGALAGWFYDALESYDYSFYTAGSVMTAGSGFMLVIFFLQRAKQRCHGHPAKTSEGRHEHVEPGSNPFDPEFAGSKFDDLGRVNPLFFMRERVESERNKGEVGQWVGLCQLMN
ncbi:monocarboxylate transporter 5-like isoform X2 [Acanthaster planci]|uniref:Monocarboxylate transporter 5-like isoform X2 n=1 Tax=Acanthaster planci TaxID=133434 RepID=A0A8B7YBJ4_ACAPL|nr:monocarboxylate transporter 5-like isoform X2 [Acanthaster planci]